uniref:Uncharacterized protein n=1 Tax=Panagrolaimus davidi TaxID=227884 RepID=A0A914PRN1_9BILA
MLPNRTPTHSFKLCDGGNYETPVLNGNSIKNRSPNLTPSRNMNFRGATEGDRYISQHDQEHFDSAKFSYYNERASSSLQNSLEKDVVEILHRYHKL